ncbi:OLC1v1027212C1 [Oldenlandia corymbosa var. corymbosa]|uniref:OLC1v1027212C1 n=1 Tax=Oldenlandia corymbosa var. corymbosa TaxID=529605 RepID=A0AAV1C8X7_OLDCO|nr:OLC1v1027212C1 [Oldenlandia corymbosa var. corymbosa]
MEKYNIFTLFFLALLALFSLAEASSSSSSVASSKATITYTNFIKTKCSTATNSLVCLQTLYPFAATIQTSNLKLCTTALEAAINGTKNASTTVTKLANQKQLSSMDVAALKDCLSDSKDAVSELKHTISALQHLKGPDRDFQWANAKTWGSAALSYAESCRDGFSVKKRVTPAVRQKIDSSFAKIEKLMSISLFFINHLY